MAEKADYVLVHSKDGSEDPRNEQPFEETMTLEEKERKRKRKRFEDALRKERFTIVEVIGDKVFKKLHCQFERLCEEAERVKLEMPLEGVSKR